MKTIKKRLLAIGLALAMVFSTLSALGSSLAVYADAADPITVYLTVSIEGEISQASDKSLMVWKPVYVTDLDEDGKITYDEALKAAHALYNSADGYDNGGGFVQKFWGIETIGNLFFINNVGLPTGVTTETVEAGDMLVAAVLTDTDLWMDYYAYFNETKISASTNEPVELILTGYMAAWGGKEAVMPDIALGYYTPDGKFTALETTTDDDGAASITFEEPGIYYVSTVPDDEEPFIAPVCTVVVSDTSFTAEANGEKLDITDYQEDGYTYPDWSVYPPASKQTGLFLLTIPAGTETVDLTFSANALAYNYDSAGNYIDGYYEDYQVGASTATVSVDADSNGETDYIFVQTPYYPSPESAYGEESDVLYVITFAYDEPVTPEEQEDVSKDLEDVYSEAQKKVYSIVSGEGSAADKQWFAMDLARDLVYNEDLGVIPSPDGTFIEEFVNDIIDKKGVLDTNEYDYTNYAKAILTLTSVGIDASDVDGINLVEKLAAFDKVTGQGVNGVIYALLALDCAPYDLPEDSSVTRDTFIDAILNAQLADGGWDYANKAADPDMTAIAIQALAPYYNKNSNVKIAVDKALATLSALQQDDGGFQTADAEYAESSESTSMVILALLALGIDPAADVRFIKNGKTTIDNLCSFAAAGGGFKHTADGGYNVLATDQGYRALVGYFRMINGASSVYDMGNAEELIPVNGHLHEELFTFDITDEEAIKYVSNILLKDKTIATMNGTIIWLIDAEVFIFDEEGQFIDLVSVSKNEKEIEINIPTEKLSLLGDKILIAGIHDNEVITIEPTSVDRKSGIIKFKTSKFSYYAVVSATEVPATGDNTNSAIWMMLMSLAILAILSTVVIVSRRKLHR